MNALDLLWPCHAAASGGTPSWANDTPQIAGAGFSWLPSFVCGRDIREGRLIPVLEDHGWGSLGLYALYPHRRFVPNRLRLFIDFLAERLGGKADEDPWAP